MGRPLLAAAALLALLALHAAGNECEDKCAATPGCKTASNSPPGGLSPEDIPQFIVLTNDDAITMVTAPLVFNITDRHKNFNGCPMPATWFVSVDYTDPALVRQAYEKGHEIATHTVHHPYEPNATEILGAKLWLNQTAGIPLEEVTGFRAPFLRFTPQQRQDLLLNGFQYDSSISERWNPKNPLSPSASHLVWPYTLDCGVAQDCTVSSGVCEAGESAPGVWEFPLYTCQQDNGTILSAMDPQGDQFEVYEREFENRYYGNRAPLGIFLHAAWLLAEPERAEKINSFIEYALLHEDVHLATIQQVLDWMQNPVPASQYDPGCPSKRASLGTPSLGTPTFSQAKCGHPLLDFTGVTTSGAAKASLRYAEALKAVDGSCSTCAGIEAVDGQSRFSLKLAAAASFTGVQLLASSPATVTVRVGSDATSGGLNNPVCAQDFNLPANTSTVLPCAAAGNMVTISSSTRLQLCDVHPVIAASPSPPPSSAPGTSPTSSPTSSTPRFPVVIELDIFNSTVDSFKSSGAAALCTALVSLTGDTGATCTLVTVTANAGGRRRLQASAQDSIHAVLQVMTAYPEVAARVFANSFTLASLLQPLGLSISPASIQVTIPTPSPSPTPASASGQQVAAPTISAPNAASPASNSSSSNKTGAIVGGVVGGVGGALVIASVTAFLVIRRRKAAAEPGAGLAPVRTTQPPSTLIGVVTATVTSQPNTPRRRALQKDGKELP